MYTFKKKSCWSIDWDTIKKSKWRVCTSHSRPLITKLGFPGVPSIKNGPANVGGTDSISRSGRSPGVGNGNPLQYSCLEHPMDRRAWQVRVHGVTKSQTQLSKHTHTHIHKHTQCPNYFWYFCLLFHQWPSQDNCLCWLSILKLFV